MKIDITALRAVAQMNHVPADDVINAVTSALNDAYQATTNPDPDATVTISETGDIVVTLADGSTAPVPGFGHIAVATARQAVQTWVKDLERRRVVGVWATREGRVIEAVVTGEGRGGELRLTAEGTQAVLPAGEQTDGEELRAGATIQVLLLAANVDNRGNTKLTVSRRQPSLVTQLIHDNCLEVRKGIVEVVAAAREPGIRTKVALRSHDTTVDPVQAVVGAGGTRMRAVLAALAGEKVDLVRYDEDIATYAAAALTPARVTGAVLLDPVRRQVQVHVRPAELAAANGADGINLRLATRLTKARIAIAQTD